MKGAGFVEHDFGGEPRRFLVRIGELRKIQTTCDAGPGEIARRLARCVALRTANPSATTLALASTGLGDWRVDDVREPIFQGLIGAGMAPNEAGRLMRIWVDERGFKGLVENAELALVLILAGIDEPKDDPVGEPLPEENPPEKSSSPDSTASEKSSD